MTIIDNPLDARLRAEMDRQSGGAHGTIERLQRDLAASFEEAFSHSRKAFPLGDTRLRAAFANGDGFARSITSNPGELAGIIAQLTKLVEVFSAYSRVPVDMLQQAGMHHTVDWRADVERIANPAAPVSPPPPVADWSGWLSARRAEGWLFLVENGKPLARPPQPPARAARPDQVVGVKHVLSRHADAIVAAIQAASPSTAGYIAGA